MTIHAIKEAPQLDFESLLRIAADLCAVPMVMISSYEKNAVQVKYQLGIPNHTTITRFCEYAVHGLDLMEVQDATQDPKFADAEEVRGPPFIRFYAAVPLVAPDGSRLGTLAILDGNPRRLDDRQKQLLYALAHQVMVHFELRRQRLELEDLAAQLDRANTDLRTQAEHLKQAQHIAGVGSWKYLIEEGSLQLSEQVLHMYGVTAGGFDASMPAFMDLVHPEDRGAVEIATRDALTTGRAEVQCRVVRPDGQTRHVEIIGQLFNESDGRSYLAGTTQDITARKAAEEKIRYLAYYDQLTGLPNRQSVMDRIEGLVAMRRRMPHDGAVLFIDLDNFKNLNDTHGHEMGDLLLRQVAERLRSCVRHYDCVGRFGGDEFVVVLENIGETAINAANHALNVAQKIVSTLNQVYPIKTIQHRITASIGIALINGEHVTKDELLKRADMAMYKAKSDGRNGIRFFSTQMQEVVDARARLEADLRETLANKRFTLHYQPQVDLQGRILGVEALLRWEHPRSGGIGPGEFIPVAEELGLIMEIGAWLLEEACEQLARWAENPATRDLVLSINVSARQFLHPDFVHQMRDTLSATGADPSRLKIEITESLLIKDFEETSRKMMELKTLGVRFSLDDFGTGYSSLAYLQRLPLDQLKIDQSFVQDVATNPNDAAITRAIIGLAQNLGLSVIAEGVETRDQQRFLSDEGCSNFQGFLHFHPVPAKSIEVFAARNQ